MYKKKQNFGDASEMKMKALIERIMLEEPEKLAKLLSDWFGPKFRHIILREVVEALGVNKVARLSGKKSGSISNALRGTRGVGYKLFYAIIKGVAKEYPHVLKFALEIALTKAEEENKLISEILESLIDQKKKEKTT